MSQDRNIRERFSRLSQTKRALLDQWLQGSGNTTANDSLENIASYSGEAPAPLSYSQRSIWSLLKRHPTSAVYNFPFGCFRIRGPLNRTALRQSLDAIIQRHEILRTNFVEIDGEPVQSISPQKRTHIAYVSLGKGHEDKIQQLLAQEAQQPFERVQGPFLRSLVLELGVDEHILIFTSHRLVADGWSRGIFSQELTTLYAAYCTSSSQELSDLPFQYSHYARWQQKILEREIGLTQMAYWLQHLHNLPVLLLPTDSQSPALENDQAIHLAFTIPSTLAHALRKLSQSENVTLLMLLLAAFKLLLYRTTRQQDLAIATPISNRNQNGVEGLIGNFMNTLIIRTNLAHMTTFRELVQEVRKEVLEAYAHTLIPVEKIAAELGATASLSNAPLSRCLFIIHDVPLPHLQFYGVEAQDIEIGQGRLLQDLALTTHVVGDDFQCYLRAKSALFRPETMHRLVQAWQALLAEIVTDPAQSLSSTIN